MDFVDDGYTGSNFDRPGFQKMMDGVRSGEIDTIIVKDLSRFGRDYIGVGEYMEQIFHYWVSGSSPSMTTMTAAIIMVQPWGWIWLSAT